MKKIISVLLCLAVVLQLFVFNPGVSSAEAETPTMEQYVLDKLGVVVLEGNEDLNGAVTRAEFVSYINNILKVQATGGESYFIDVPNSYWAAESINALLEQGVVSYARDGRFNPDETITYDQACKLLVCTLGYGAYADFGNEGMIAYVKVASRLNFDITPADSSAITLNEAINIIFSAMQVVTAYSMREGDESKTVVSEDDTLFSMYYNVYIGEGKVNAYYGCSIDTEVEAENEVLIDETKFYKDTDCSTEGLIGSYCDIVYTDIDGDKTLIYAEIMNEDKTVISSDLINSYDSETLAITYYESEDAAKTSSVTLPAYAEIVYNGRSFSGNVSDKIAEFISGSKRGEITVISSGRGAETRVVIINSYDVFIAGAYNEGEGKLYGYYDNSKVYETGSEKQVIMETNTGVVTKIPSVFPSAMLVAESEDKKVINIIVCSAQEQITVKEVKDNGAKVVTADGKTVKIDSKAREYKAVELGGTYTITYDIYGDVIYIAQSNVSDLKIGYLRYIKNIEDVFENNWYVRLYDRTDKAFYDIKLADNITIDNIRYDREDYKSWIYAIPGNTLLQGTDVTVDRQVIRYKTDSEGNISEIDTYNCSEAEDKGSTLTRIADASQQLYYLSYSSRFGMNVLFDTSITKYITVPVVTEDGKVDVNGEMMEETAALYSDTPTLANWTNYYIEAYKFDDSTLAADVIVLNQNPKVTRYDFIMFDSLSEGLDSEGMEIKVLNGVSNGSMVSLGMTEACIAVAQSLKKGDIVKVDTTADGLTISLITKAFDYETKTFENNGSYTDRNRYWYYGNISQRNSQSVWQGTNHQIVKAYPYELKGTALSAVYSLGDAYKGNAELVSKLSGGVGVYDPSLNRNEIYAGSAADIVTYKNAGEDCDFILICSRTTSVRQIFVYK